MTAQDAGNNTVTSFNGTAKLTARGPGGVQVLSWIGYGDSAEEYPRTKQAISTHFPNYTETSTAVTVPTRRRGLRALYDHARRSYRERLSGSRAAEGEEIVPGQVEPWIMAVDLGEDLRADFVAGTVRVTADRRDRAAEHPRELLLFKVISMEQLEHHELLRVARGESARDGVAQQCKHGLLGCIRRFFRKHLEGRIRIFTESREVALREPFCGEEPIQRDTREPRLKWTLAAIGREQRWPSIARRDCIHEKRLRNPVALIRGRAAAHEITTQPTGAECAELSKRIGARGKALLGEEKVVVEMRGRHRARDRGGT